MKITSVSVSHVEGGLSASVTAFFPTGTEIEADDVAKLTAILSGDVVITDNAKAGAAALHDAAPTGGRRRRGAASAPAAEAQPSVASTPSADTASGGRRRRGASPTAASAESTTAPTVTEPAVTTSRGRRRASSAAADTTSPEATVSTAETTSPSSGRRQRSAPVATDKGLTDLDLRKAASDAAQQGVSPAVIIEILANDFGVVRVDDLAPDKRQAFLDELNFQVEG